MVSYIIPTYYREELLKPQLEALALQTNMDFEVIISDDGAQSNRAMDLCRSCGATYIWNPRGPMYWLTRTVNSGFKVARGEWLAVLTNGCLPARNLTENIGKPGLFDKTVLWTMKWNHIGGDTGFGVPARAFYNQEPITHQLLDVWENNKTVDWRTVALDNTPESLAVWNGPGKTNRHIINFSIGAALIHKSLLDKIGLMDETYQGYGCEDGAWAATAVKTHGVSIGYSHDLLIHHLPHPRPISESPERLRIQEERERNWQRLIREHPGIWV